MEDSVIVRQTYSVSIAIAASLMHGDSLTKDANVSQEYFLKEKIKDQNYQQNSLQACNCNSVGAKSDFCNQKTGECTCYENKSGKKCTKCLSGFYKFPKCLKCECNGFSNECDMTGSCLNCLSNTEGTNCERFNPFSFFEYL